MITPSKVEGFCKEVECTLNPGDHGEGHYWDCQASKDILLRRAVAMLREMDACWNTYEKQAGKAADEILSLRARAEKAEKELADLRLRINGFLIAEGESPVTFPEER